MPKLRPVLDSVDSLDDSLKSLYVQKDGKYMLDLDGLPPGAVDRAKLDEFRENNIGLMRQLEELKAQFEGVDPNKYREIVEQERKLKDKELIEAGKIDKLLEQRTERMREEFSAQLEALQAANEQLEEAFSEVLGAYSQTKLMSELTRAVDQVGKVRKGALDDIIGRASTVWTINDDGDLVAMNGERPIFGADGKAPISMSEWLGSLSESAPHLFENSSGACAGNGGGGGGGGGGGKVISRNDSKAFINNLEGIAKGTVAVEG